MRAPLHSFVYRLSMGGFALGARILSLWNQKARLWVRGRKDWRARLKAGLPPDDQPLIWFHAASVGEFEQARPLIEGWKVRWPTHRILLTFFSPSGYELRKDYPLVDQVCYLPLDTPANARDFLAIAQPKLAVFIKYEFWRYYFAALQAQDIPLLHACTILRPDQRFFRSGGDFHRETLRAVTQFFVQTEETAKLLASIGLTNATVVGDTRADRVAAIVSEPFDDPILAAFHAAESKPILALGSVWPSDLIQLETALEALRGKCRLLIAPHEMHEAELSAWCDVWDQAGTRHSLATRESAAEHRILVIDSIGKLSKLYRFADLAYIGGAFGKGLHNTLEPAAYGLPIAFGPKYGKFQEAKDLIAQGAAVSCQDAEALREVLTRWVEMPEVRQEAGKKAAAYVSASQGASEQILAQAVPIVTSWKG